MAKITFDGIEVEVPDGTTILNAARKIGGSIVPPAMCYYTPLKGSGGKCRACLVRIAAGSAKDPRPMPKLVASCITPVQDGMVVENTTNQQVLDVRKGIVEMLLINHPLDCPVCDQAGECDLQNFAFEHGVSTTRYEEERRTFEKIDIGPYIQLHMTRCILCYRCVYTADQLTDARVHVVLGRGDAAEIGTYIENTISNDFSGNVIDVCPVG
ncbi:MAG: 2Fe-2S iron-sulfur cluster binding domain-containing protein, partial [Hymenobacter sp.]